MTRKLPNPRNRHEEAALGIDAEFCRVLSHEIRTPVNGLLGAGELLNVNSEDHKLLELFNTSGNRILRLIEDMELLFRLNTTAPHLERVSLEAFCNLIPLAPPQGLGGQEIFIQVEPEFLGLAFRTLREITICFQNNPTPPEKGSPPRISLKNNVLNIAYILTRLKISDEQAENLFRMEYYGRCSTPAEALGLSPAVAYQIVERVGGTLEIHKLTPSTGFLVLHLPLA